MESQSQTWHQWYLNAREDIGVILGVLGIALAFVGFWISIRQIRKTADSARSAKNAALSTRRIVSDVIATVDGAQCLKYIDEVKIYLDADKLEAAAIRIADLSHEVVQMHERLKQSDKKTFGIKFTAMSGQIDTVREMIDAGIADPDNIDMTWVRPELASLSTEISRMIGKMKVHLEGEK